VSECLSVTGGLRPSWAFLGPWAQCLFRGVPVLRSLFIGSCSVENRFRGVPEPWSTRSTEPPFCDPCSAGSLCRGVPVTRSPWSAESLFRGSILNPKPYSHQPYSPSPFPGKLNHNVDAHVPTLNPESYNNQPLTPSPVLGKLNHNVNEHVPTLNPKSYSHQP
jgi:hypothetical protein